jgi:pimeloyl-ACP methyl ester carboxylesterase
MEITRWKRFAPQRERLLRLLARAAACVPRFPVVIPMYLDLGRVFAGTYGFSLERGLRDARLSYPLAYVASLFSADLAYLAQPGKIRCPVLGMVAADDALFTPEFMRAMLDRIRAPQKELVVMPGGGHMAPVSPRGAAEYAAVIHEHCVALGLFPSACA